jgi:transcriptional regulator with XRE-family HTH domain
MGSSAATPPSKITRQPVHNRIMAVLAHIPRYAFQGETRLAKDSGVSKSAICRVVTGQSSPSFALVHAVTRALEKHLGRRIDPREIVSLDGSYPTESVCKLTGCRGCLPERAYDAEEVLRPEFKAVQPGRWSGSIAPRRQPAVSEEA